jgi:hypothetical protein
MKILILAIAFFTTNIVLSQGVEKVKKDSISENEKAGYQTGVFSLGVGVTKVLGLESGYSDQSSTLFLFTVNSAVHLYKPWYIGLGLDVYKEPKNPESVILGLNIIPSLRFNYGGNKTTLWFSAGGFLNFHSAGSDPIAAGPFLSVKFQYNWDKNMSTGIELKMPMTYTYNLGYRVLLLNFYVSAGGY